MESDFRHQSFLWTWTLAMAKERRYISYGYSTEKELKISDKSNLVAFTSLIEKVNRCKT